MDTTKFAWADNTIYWDVEDISILNDLDPILVKENISSDLEDKGFEDMLLQIVAFVDDNVSETVKKAYSRAGIFLYPVPKGNKYARVQILSVKILNWALGYGTALANLFILSENMKEEKEVVSIVEALRERGNYNIVFQELGSLLNNCGVVLSHESNTLQTQGLMPWGKCVRRPK